MMDVGKEKAHIDCPECKRKLEVTLHQVAKEETVKCSCGQKVDLKDNNGSTRKTIRDANESFKSLEKTIKNIGKK